MSKCTAHSLYDAGIPPCFLITSYDIVPTPQSQSEVSPDDIMIQLRVMHSKMDLKWESSAIRPASRSSEVMMHPCFQLH